MDQATLVSPDIEAGRALIDRLQEKHVPLAGALWLYVPEASTWRLLLISPQLDQWGPKRLYQLIQKELEDMPSPRPDLSEVSLVSPRDPVAQVLQGFVRIGGRGGAWLHDSVFNGIPLGHAYIYGR